MTPFRKGVRLIPFLFLVEVFCDVVTGVLEISSNGEHGAKGQNGGRTVFQVSGPLRLETYLLHFIIMHIISKLQEMYFELSLRWI